MTTITTALAQRVRHWSKMASLTSERVSCLSVEQLDEIADALAAKDKQIFDSENRVRQQNRHVCELFDDNTALRQRIAELEPIHAAAGKLVRCKGRYHSELNYRALAALFGVTTPDLPPLDGEARPAPAAQPVTVKLPKAEIMEAADFSWDAVVIPVSVVEETLAAAGIKVEGE